MRVQSRRGGRRNTATRSSVAIGQADCSRSVNGRLDRDPLFQRLNNSSSSAGPSACGWRLNCDRWWCLWWKASYFGGHNCSNPNRLCAANLQRRRALTAPESSSSHHKEMRDTVCPRLASGPSEWRWRMVLARVLVIRVGVEAKRRSCFGRYERHLTRCVYWRCCGHGG